MFGFRVGSISTQEVQLHSNKDTREEGRGGKLMAANTGANKPLSLSLPRVYFDILETMDNMAGRDVRERAAKRLMQIIIEKPSRNK